MTHIALREAGLAFKLERVDLQTKQLADGGDFNLINAKGYVPVLELNDGQLLTEGPAIVQYIADRDPGSGLAPAAGTLERYRLQEWLNFISSEVHKQFSPLFKRNSTAEMKQASRDNLARRFDWLEKQLQDRLHLMGPRFTIADCYLYTILNWSRFTDIDLKRWPALQQYVDRITHRPKVWEARVAEGLIGS